MSKKYLSLEEAAEQLGISTQDLNKAREAGDIRGFADRASWKFRDQDVQEYARSMGMDSAPDVPIIDESESVLDEEPLMDDSASDVRLILDDELISGDSSETDEVTLPPEESGKHEAFEDSNVPLSAGSDSDVRLVDTDDDDASAGGLTSGIQEVTESDVRPPGSDDDQASGVTSGIQEISGSDVASDVTYENSSNVLEDEDQEDEDGLTLAAGSSILGGEESGISLDAADSGISLEAGDSGISLESLDSGINLDQNDSTAEFLTDDDSAIPLTGGDDDSGISLEGGDDVGQTVQMDAMGDDGELQMDDTQFEMEASGDGSSEYEITGLGDDDEQDDTSVLLLDDEDDTDEGAPTMIGGDDFDDEDTFDLGDDDGGAFNEFEDDDLMVEETVIGDDDEFDDMEVFDAVDEDFDDDFDDMGSQGEFAAPVGMRTAAAPEVELGTGTFVGVMISSVLMVICGLIMVDLVRSMWSFQQPASYTSGILDMIKGMF